MLRDLVQKETTTLSDDQATQKNDSYKTSVPGDAKSSILDTPLG